MCKTRIDWLNRVVGRLRQLPHRVHNDERGTISIVTVFALLMFTMLLVMIVNVGIHIDDKLKMQNAADAATYSGGTVLARGMNGLAFSNHLLGDVFAMTAFLRESRDRNAESLIPPVLAAWRTTGETLSRSEFQRFRDLGLAIVAKVPLEQEAVTSFGELSAGASTLTLPVFEHILKDRLIGRFQRHLMLLTPELSQAVTNEVARRHGLLGSSSSSSPLQARDQEQRGPQMGLLWRTTVMPVSLGDEMTPQTRTLPVIDPDPLEMDYSRINDAEVYLQHAIEQRRRLAKRYLADWNSDRLRLFQRRGKMSMFFSFWRMATCAHLEDLLTVEYPLTNLPMMMRRADDGREVEGIIQQAEQSIPGLTLNRSNDDHHTLLMDLLRGSMDVNDFVDRNFQFVGVVSRKHRRETGPGMFRNPLSVSSDAQTFAQVMLFVPRPRRVLAQPGGPPVEAYGGTLGADAGGAQAPPVPGSGGAPIDPLFERWVSEGWPTHWDLLNQNWMVQLVPATTTNLPRILETNAGGEFAQFRPPSYAGVGSRQLKQINTH